MQLRDYVRDAGPGFCCRALPELLPQALEDSPLLIAIDTNIVIELGDRGPFILDDEESSIEVADPWLHEQLVMLGNIINMWLVRDIRFVVLPKAYTDYKRPPSTQVELKRHQKRVETLNQIVEALSFQTQAYCHELEVKSAGHANGCIDAELANDLSLVPKGADRTLVLEAILNRVDVFLTLDKRILRATTVFLKRGLVILSPAELWQRLTAGFPQPEFFFAGKMEHDNCLYGWNFLTGDTGKWSYLLSAIR